MAHEVKVAERTATLVLSKRLPVHLPEIGAALGAAFGEVYEYLGVRGVAPEGPPFVIYQRRNAEATAGEVRWFDTLIVPHDASQIGASAANVTVVYDDGTAVALEVKVPSGSAIETWTIVDNPDRKQIALPNLATALVARREPGVPNYLLASEATNVRVGPSGEQARIEYAWGPVPNSVEYNGF